MLYSKTAKVTSRVGHKVLETGQKVRYLLKTGEIIDSAEEWKKVHKKDKKDAKRPWGIMVVFTIFERIQVDFVCLLSRCLLPNMSDTTQRLLSFQYWMSLAELLVQGWQVVKVVI